jgi:hypothetical protein
VEESQMKRLQSIGFVWDYQLFSWEVHYSNLKTKILERQQREQVGRTTTKNSLSLELSTNMKEWIEAQIYCLENPYLISEERQRKLRRLFNDRDDYATWT